MKKTNRKLVLRKEIVRELSAQALSRAIGGQETDTANAVPWSRDRVCEIAAVPFSRDRVCEIAAVPYSGDKVCLTA